SDVAKAASNFLNSYHPSLSLPIPIEEIVEHKMNISLFVIPNIKSLLGIDAFINAAFTQLTVDEACFTKFPERTRFSIAHEIGHLILHKEWYINYGPKDLTDYLNFPDRIDDQDYKYIEIQAHTFAGLILVPTDKLLEELEKRLGKIPSKESPEILSPAVQDLPEVFQVSDMVILRRLQKEGIVKDSH
ncbi:MAG: ImmA/IrrE family metallo-endopeptidase, partial [bacterium]|nr:ImmA/IrrE family metallo-endopeptidase [bacterium]